VLIFALPVFLASFGLSQLFIPVHFSVHITANFSSGGKGVLFSFFLLSGRLRRLQTDGCCVDSQIGTVVCTLLSLGCEIWFLLAVFKKVGFGFFSFGCVIWLPVDCRALDREVLLL
jgi:hypothetical protein